jgi:hypothetical protein
MFRGRHGGIDVTAGVVGDLRVQRVDRRGGRRVRAALTSRGLAGVTGDAEAIVAEFVANAARHAGSPVDLALIAAGGVLMIIAADSSRMPPVISLNESGSPGLVTVCAGACF